MRKHLETSNRSALIFLNAIFFSFFDFKNYPVAANSYEYTYGTSLLNKYYTELQYSLNLSVENRNIKLIFE